MSRFTQPASVCSSSSCPRPPTDRQESLPELGSGPPTSNERATTTTPYIQPEPELEPGAGIREPETEALPPTVAHQNKRGVDRPEREREERRTGPAYTQHKKTLLETIELSLRSPIFKELGSDARELLAIVAFFPQGINEENLDRFFPTVPNRGEIFDTFCILSLTYRSEGFVKMLAPLRHHLGPKDPLSSPLLCTVRDHYISQLKDSPNLERPEFGDVQWVMSEDRNIEHLLSIFTSVDPSSERTWDACAGFIARFSEHKPRLVTLGRNIEGLPDSHPSKAQCLYRFSGLISVVGDYAESKRLVAHTLKLWRDQGDLYQVTVALSALSSLNRHLGLFGEGIQLAKEALEISQQLEDTQLQTEMLSALAMLFLQDNQVVAAEETASQAIALLPENSRSFATLVCYHALAEVYRVKGNSEEAIKHFKVALGVASSHSWHTEAFWIHQSLTVLFADTRRFEDASAHLERAKLHVPNNPHCLVRTIQLQAEIFYRQGRIGEAKSEYLRAAEGFEKIGATVGAEVCRKSYNNLQTYPTGMVSLSFWNGCHPSHLLTLVKSRLGGLFCNNFVFTLGGGHVVIRIALESTPSVHHDQCPRSSS